IVADRTARFAFPELRLGLVPGFGGIPRLRRALGGAVVRDVVLTGRSVSAARMHALGLVAELVGPGEQGRAARALAAHLGRLDPEASRRARALLAPVPEAELRAEREVFLDLVERPAVQAALERFVTRTDAMTWLP
ncbi:MAG: enoyl-CoA hydratase/isomerase family protein, partial [Myxococcota bacterium]|nr:enoyl-CoA hydratase/isomerase family protein [Myxococcota bacterium]